VVEFLGACGRRKYRVAKTSVPRSDVVRTLDYAVLGLQKRVFLVANRAQSSGRETANGKPVGQW